jgi:Rod binding domain-containing protein
MTTPDEILKRGIEEVTKILGFGIAEQIFNQLQKKKEVASVKDSGSDTCSGQSTLSHFR